MPLEFGKSYSFTQLVKYFKSKVDQRICYKLYSWCIQNIVHHNSSQKIYSGKGLKRGLNGQVKLFVTFIILH